MHAQLGRRADQVVTLALHEGASRGIDIDDVSVEVDHRHADRRMIERYAEALFGSAESRLSPFTDGDVAGRDDNTGDSGVIGEVLADALELSVAAVGRTETQLERLIRR